MNIHRKAIYSTSYCSNLFQYFQVTELHSVRVPKETGRRPQLQLRQNSCDSLLSLCFQMKDLRHENINPLVGFFYDSGMFAIVTEFCSRRSLEDILMNQDVKLDWMFKSSLLLDLIKVNGKTENPRFSPQIKASIFWDVLFSFGHFPWITPPPSFPVLAPTSSHSTLLFVLYIYYKVLIKKKIVCSPHYQFEGQIYLYFLQPLGFSVGKESASSAGDARDVGLIHGWRISPGEALHFSIVTGRTRQRSLVGQSP